jgi:glycine dehydrogenase
MNESSQKNLFINRHLGPSDGEIQSMLKSCGLSSLNELISETIPASVLDMDSLQINAVPIEQELLKELRSIADENQVFRSYIGMGYYGTYTPPVILRNILENPAWYTQYTPYQAEISQGRLEALFNFQTMICDFSGMDIANASLLDESTAAAEAMTFLARVNPKRNKYFVASNCHPQTIAVLKTRAKPIGIELNITEPKNFKFNDEILGGTLQYPATDGEIHDYTSLCIQAHNVGSYIAVAADLLSLALLKPPGEWGADVVVGTSQRFGVPMGYGGPHAAFFATRKIFERKIPGRIIGLSKDTHGNPALRMALQTREQHIRRERATSNICTAQVLLAVISGMYTIYHGPGGIRKIAEDVHRRTCIVGSALDMAGYRLHHSQFFDTIRFNADNNLFKKAQKQKINLRDYRDGSLGISLDETVADEDINTLLDLFGAKQKNNGSFGIPNNLRRTSSYLKHPVFSLYHSETEMLRYIYRLQQKDLSLTTSMIPLGSCTMKLNATTEMIGITWPEFSDLHPFAPKEQTRGYRKLIAELGGWLCNITGFSDYSFQPNSGAQGEFTGLKIISEYHKSRGDSQRTVCLIPTSAHGTNPASAVMTGMSVVIVQCDKNGNIDVDDLTQKAKTNSNQLAAFMVTYPSTHGVFEEHIVDICRIIHDNGGQIYLDGANLNAMMGLCKPAEFGADVCHINLHKTFCIPHGGGGPGMGPIFTKKHLAPFLPDHPVISTGGEQGIDAVSSAPWGSASILPISWAFIRLLGDSGIKKTSQVAILNANYMAKKLSRYFTILYTGATGRVGHEFILDLRPFRKSCEITDEDVAKRLMDYGFHAPTVSFPVPGTLMIEPTESESKGEMDRFCFALIHIKKEILDVESGRVDLKDNVLKNAPHTAQHAASDSWNHSYTREEAAYPAEWTRESKFWPAVSRIDNVHGDRNLVCTCSPIEQHKN